MQLPSAINFGWWSCFTSMFYSLSNIPKGNPPQRMRIDNVAAYTTQGELYAYVYLHALICLPWAHTSLFRTFWLKATANPQVRQLCAGLY